MTFKEHTRFYGEGVGQNMNDQELKQDWLSEENASFTGWDF